MNRVILPCFGLVMAIFVAPLRADVSVDHELQTDVLLRAMVDELERNAADLKLEDLARPYFIEYAMADGTYFNVQAALGAVTRRNSGRMRPFRSDVRVGSYELDNANFAGEGGFGGFGGMFGGAGTPMPIEDDYAAIRQSIWWTSDVDYKGVAENLVRKQAFMENKLVEDKPADFSREEPAAYFEPRADLRIDEERLEQLTVQLSALFREFPDVRESEVTATAAVGNKYVVNTEGTRMRTTAGFFSISVSATVQSDDGMLLSDSTEFETRTFAELPPAEEMLADCRKMVTKLLEVRAAPTLDSYTGPVLFDGPAAAAAFAMQFATRFPGGQRPVGSRTSPDDFSKKLGKRILPKSVTVVDDPTRERIGETPTFGHYVYDDQGVRARPVTLVEEGRLKAQLMSRNPSKEFAHSTGHGRGIYQPRAAIANLIVTASDAVDEAGMRQELKEACEDEDLEYGIRVASLGSVGGGSGGRFARFFRGGGGSYPLVMYKVFLDGREELVRGAEIAGVNLKAFKRLLAMGDAPYVLNQAGRTGDSGNTVAVPALLFEELDLAKIDRDFDKPPILPSPLAREQTD